MNAPRARTTRAPLVVVLIAGLVGIGLAITGATAPTAAGLRFAQIGHWVANPGLGKVFHVNGAASGVDASVEVPGMDEGSTVVQGDRSGYVVGGSRIVQFGKSSLRVENTTKPPSSERPVSLEAAGGPYLVYRDAGQIVRLGDNPTTVGAGGALADPVVTPAGTLWLHRTESGSLCKLPRKSAKVSCVADVPNGHTGGLSVLGDQPVFVDSVSDTWYPVGDDGLGEATPLGIDMPAEGAVAPTDVDGKLAVLDRDGHRMHLIDTAGGRNPRSVRLPDGEYQGPSVSGKSVVVVDERSGDVLSYDARGKQRGKKPLPRESGEPRMSRGEDGRVYVDDQRGDHTVVVDEKGDMSDVAVTGDAEKGDRGEQSQERRDADRRPVRRDERQQKPDARITAPTQQPPPVNPGTQPGQQPGDQPQAPGSNPGSNPPPGNGSNPPSNDPPPQQATKPGMPTGLWAVLDPEGDAAAQWGAAPDNGSAITAYRVTWSAPGAGSGSATLGGGAWLWVQQGLQPGTSYTVTVTARNAAGWGTPASTQMLVDNG